jgi:gluconolactonase
MQIRIFAGTRILATALLLAAVPAFTVATAANGSLVAPGAELKKVGSGFGFTEGPAADANGDVYFSDIPNNRIHKWTQSTGQISVHRENTAKGNGNKFNRRGQLITCEMDNHRVVLDDLKGHIRSLTDSYTSGELHMLNDLWIDAKGGIYFSDFGGGGGPPAGGGVAPGGAAPGGGGERLQLYYISPDYKSVKRVTTDMSGPNGVVGSPDGRILYAADDATVVTYRIGKDGSLSDKHLFLNQRTDGMAMDERGNLYLAGESIRIYTPSGEQIGNIATSEPSANLTFAGKDRKTLFITARTSVYTIQMVVRGAGAPLDRR